MLNFITVCAYISIIFGAFECFFGFRVMRPTRAVNGFTVGAAAGVLIGVLTENNIVGISVIVLLGALLSILSYKIHLVGVFLFTSSLTGTAVYLAFGNLYAALIAACFVGIFAIFFVKPVSLAVFPLAGAEIAVQSFMFATGIELSLVVHIAVFVSLVILGFLCQLLISWRYSPYSRAALYGAYEDNGNYENYENYQNAPQDVYYEPVLQRAYRNYCIKCGSEMPKDGGDCVNCGFSFYS